jgi:stearoyl-CoA 9-desaturase NADPH oxidoreductase
MPSVSSRLLAALAHPRALDDYLSLANPLHSSRELRARVVTVRRETSDVATLVLSPNALWRGHRAGQHVALTAELRGVRRTRTFSIASAPGQPLELTVKARPGGVVTPEIVRGALLGQLVTLSKPAGDFVLPDVPPERVLLLSGGSGITPVMSMLRARLSRGHRGQVAFVHHARSEADVIFAEELARAARPSVTVSVRTGPLSPESLAAFADWEAWACGPEPFLDAARRALRTVHVERFSAPALRSDGASGTSGASRTSGARTEAAAVRFSRSNKDAKGTGPLLGIAEGAGLTPPSGCRMGLCHTCTCRKVSGTTRDVRTGALSTERDVDIQLCVSEPVGPVDLDL